MKPIRVPVLVLSLSGLLVLVAFWLFRTSPSARLAREGALEAENAPGAAAAAQREPTLSVDALVVRVSDARSVVDVAGVLEPVRSVVVGAEVAGRVIEVAALEHAHVQEGDLLVRLDPALPEAAVQRDRASLLRAQASSRLAQAELRRQRDLAKRGVASAADLDRAESKAATTGAQVAEARARLAEALTRLDKTRILAPFSGVVSSLDLEPGAYLQPGSPVCELVDLSEIEIELGVGDRQVLALSEGDPVRVSVDVLPGQWFEGRILRPGRAPDARTRQYPVPIRVPNTDERLLPGMLGTVRFELGESRPVLRIPRRAVQREFELDYLFVLDAMDGSRDVATATRRRVETQPLPFRPDLLEVTGGLEDGERIAISGVRDLRQGLRVHFRERELGS
jgi:membrane fusion protein (multidrug efflux system)